MLIKSFTLIELIVTVVITAFVILGITSFTAFFLNAVRVNADRYNMYSQVNYAFDDMKIRCFGGIAINEPFNSTNDVFDSTTNQWTRNNLEFLGEVDPYIVDDENTTLWDPSNPGVGTKVWYRYCVDSSNACILNSADAGNLVLARSTDDGLSWVLYEVLVDSNFNPGIRFIYTKDDEPNFISVRIDATGTTPNAPIFFTEEGILFKYMEVR